MTKIIVDVIAARNLKGESELLGINGAYIQLQVGNMLIGQKQKTKQLPGIGTELAFGETFEFDANEDDNLSVKLCEDEFLIDEKLGEAKIPLKGVFETGQLSNWFPLGEDGTNTSGEVLLNIHTN